MFEVSQILELLRYHEILLLNSRLYLGLWYGQKKKNVVENFKVIFFFFFNFFYMENVLQS